VRSPIRFCLDSNILVYAVDSTEPRRHAAAIDIIARAARRDCVLVPQVLAEFFHAVTRKRMMSHADAAREASAWMTIFPLMAGPTAAALSTAMAEAVAGRYQFYDALLIATARDGGCTALITEDMSPGAVLDGVRIVPAFDGKPAISKDALALL